MNYCYTLAKGSQISQKYELVDKNILDKKHHVNGVIEL